MATISGQVIFDRDRSATISTGDSGLSNIPVVLQNTNTNERLTVLTDTNGSYAFLNVPNGSYRIVESYGAPGGVSSPGDFTAAASGSIPSGVNPPATAANNPPPGTTNLDSLTPNTLLVTASDADLSGQNFFNGPVIYTPIQTILDPCAVISGNNLIRAAENGTFGAFPQGAPPNTGAPEEPYPGVTPDFTYVLPNPSVYAPTGGEYTVQNIMTDSMSAEIGAWWRIADHTAGNETGRFMIVNGDNPGAVSFRDIIAVQPNTNYLFTAWILNLFKTTGYPDPKLGVRVLDQAGNVLYSAALGTLIPVNENAPEWKQIGSVINSQNSSSLTVEFLSEGLEEIGNDYAIDDISLNEISVPELIPIKAADRQTANVGETIRYTITLTNTCESPLIGVLFQDSVPDRFSFIPGSAAVNGAPIPEANPNAGFSLPDIQGGETVTVEFSVLVNAVPSPNPALNTADITYSYTPVEGGIPGVFHVTSNEVPVEIGNLADISVVKTADPSPAAPGGTLIYTVTVANAGPAPAINIELADDMTGVLLDVEYSTDGGASFFPWNSPLSLGTFAAGESVTVLIRGTVLTSASEEIHNTAAVSSETPDPDSRNNTSTAITPVETSADISVVKTPDQNPTRPGDMLTYLLTISNAGTSASQNVILTDTIPSSLVNPEFSMNSGVSWQPWTGALNLGTLAAGDGISVLIRAKVSPSANSSIVNTAVVSSDTPDPAPANNTDTSTVEVANIAEADISVTKRAQPETAVPGEALTYIITVANNGPEPAQNVFLFDQTPPELSNVRFSEDGGSTWSVWMNPYPLGELAAGQSRTILIRGTVISPVCGMISNTAVSTGSTPDPDLSNNTATTNTPAQEGADVVIQKTACPDPVFRCRRLIYTLIISNNGPDTAEEVVITDTLPVELCNPVYSSDMGRSWNPWSGNLNIGDLAAGNSVSIIIAGFVSRYAGSCIQNTAAVSSLTPDPNIGNNTVSLQVRVCP